MQDFLISEWVEKSEPIFITSQQLFLISNYDEQKTIPQIGEHGLYN